MVTYCPGLRLVEVSSNVSDFVKISVPKEEIKGDWDVRAGLKQVDKLVMEGYEVFNTGTSVSINAGQTLFTFYLRRKK